MSQLAFALPEPQPDLQQSCHVLGYHVCEPDYFGCTAFDAVEWLGWGLEAVTEGRWISVRRCLSEFQWWVDHG